MSVACESGVQQWRPSVQESQNFVNSSVFNLHLKVSADRVLISSAFQTAGAAAENAREDKRVSEISI